MQSIALLIVAAVVAAAMAEGEYYVPRAYYTIDAAGHASAPVPLRRLRRSVGPYPYAYPGHPGANANANANANADARANGWGGASANANANANANARAQGVGGWGVPTGVYGAANPNALRH